MSKPPTVRLSALAPTTHRQHGLFTIAQAEAVGISRSYVDRRVQWGDVVAVDYGVYRSVLTPATWHQRLLAACLAGPAVGSHRSAGVLWRVPLDVVDPLEVTALRHRRRTVGDVIWHESYLLDEHSITEIDGIPVTRADRTVLDLAAVLDEHALQRVVDDVLRRRLASVSSLGRLLERLGPLRRGSATMRKILDGRTGAVPESDLETQFELLLHAHGLPAAVPQYPVRVPDGRRLRIDYAYPDRMVGIELLGAQFHATPDQWRADTERLGVLAALGWHMLSFTYDQVIRQPVTVIRAIEHALGR
jgi:hypothetical protein